MFEVAYYFYDHRVYKTLKPKKSENEVHFFEVVLDIIFMITKCKNQNTSWKSENEVHFFEVVQFFIFKITKC